MHFISGFHRELGIADDEVSFLNGVKDKARLLAYLGCLLSGILFDEVRKMEENGLSLEGIRSMRCNILAGMYQDKDKIAQGLIETRTKMEHTVSEFRQVTDRYQKLAEEAWEKERSAYEETIRTKDEIIEKSKAYADELQSRILDMKKAAEEIGKQRIPQDTGSTRMTHGGLFGTRRQKEKEEEKKEERRRQREFEEDQFRDYILRNPRFSEEQKRLLLTRFLEGDSFWKIIRYAHPELSVEFMKALLEGRTSDN